MLGAIKGKRGLELRPSKADPRVKRWQSRRVMPDGAKKLAAEMFDGSGYEVATMLRGRVGKLKKHGQFFYSEGNVVIPELPPSRNRTPTLRASMTLGEKAVSVRAISEAIDREMPDLDENTDAYYEPYGGSLTYLLNIDVLKRTEKPIHINVSSKFEPAKAALYTAINKGDKDVIKAIKSVKTVDYRHKTGNEIVDAWLRVTYLTPPIKGGITKAPRLMEYVLDSIPELVRQLRRPNVKIWDMTDDEFFDVIKNDAAVGKRATVLDDSNYAALPGEMAADVYRRSVSHEQEQLWKDLGKTSRFDPRDADFLVAHKRPMYDAVVQNKGTVVATNHIHPTMVGMLRKYRARAFGFEVMGRKINDQKYGYLHTKRPEYLAFIGSSRSSNIQPLPRLGRTSRGNVGPAGG